MMWYCCSLQLDIVAFEGQDFRQYWQQLCDRFHDNERQEELLQECVYLLWRIWKSRNEMVFKGVFVNPMEMVNLVRQQLLEFRACQLEKKVVVDGGVAGG